MSELPKTIKHHCEALCASFNTISLNWRKASRALTIFRNQVGYAPFYQYQEQIEREIVTILKAQLPNCSDRQIQLYAQRAIEAVDRRLQSFY